MRKSFFIIFTVILLLVYSVEKGWIGWDNQYLKKLKNELSFSSNKNTTVIKDEKVRLVSEESVVVDVVKKVTPAVVTVGITKSQPVFQMDDSFGFSPFGGFFNVPRQRGSRQIKQDIGSGFIIKSDGLVLTNRHVVSDPDAKYRIITADNKSFDVKKIYRDPANDLAILKIEASDLPVIELGDSDKIQVGQLAIAIGTALGEFRSTVTTGVVSGVSRGITAGSPFEGAEKLDNVIQTSAAINPGNSGGPLLNSSGQVIGVNVAVAAQAQNIGFALPINLVKDSLKDFDSTGQFAKRAFFGVEYRMISKELAILNELPEGAYVQTVVEDSPADKAGVLKGDIIIKFDSKPVREKDGGLAKIIAGKKPGDTVEVVVDRDGESKTLNGVLGENQQ